MGQLISLKEADLIIEKGHHEAFGPGPFRKVHEELVAFKHIELGKVRFYGQKLNAGVSDAIALVKGEGFFGELRAGALEARQELFLDGGRLINSHKTNFTENIRKVNPRLARTENLRILSS